VYSTFISHVEERGDTYWFTTSVERDYAYGMYMTPRASMETVDALFSSMQFERIRLSERIHGTGEEAARAVRGESEAAQAGLKQVGDELAALLASESEAFLSRYSFVRYMNDSWGIRKYAAHTGESFYILGWVPESEYEDFARRIERLGNVNFITVADDPSGVPDFAPPVKLSNSKLFRPFESFVSMYGLPSYDEIDPTPLMAITYTVIFGIMFGDVGQGALLILLGFLMHRFKKMWLGPILCYAGLGSVAFGFVYGSVFGYEHILPGFKILEGGNANLALQTAVYLGVFLIVLAISLNIANGIRQRDLEKSVFGPNGLLGLMLYMSVVLLALPIIGFAVPEVPGVLVGAAAGVLVLLVFLREPLSKLCGRRKDWKPHNPVEFLLENVFELFEVLLSYVTNTISFLRMGAYVISHASMMLVVFMLARGTGDSDNLAVVILGNLLVMAIEGLLVGIQVLRLEFYELFGRFYSGGGRAYAPVMIDYRAKTE
jgi:V/A-type H+-transporting ATPase subunit I